MVDKEIGPLFSDKPDSSRPFRLPTGERPAQDPRRKIESQPVLATLRSERGKSIAADVRRGLLLGLVLVGVGVILALFVQAL
jgi:hypothetical protein